MDVTIRCAYIRSHVNVISSRGSSQRRHLQQAPRELDRLLLVPSHAVQPVAESNVTMFEDSGSMGPKSNPNENAPPAFFTSVS